MHRRLSIPLLLLSALACGRDQQANTDTAGSAARAEVTRGPDPILIRLPRTGGTVRAYLYPHLDSAVWSGHTTSVDRVLGFDPEGGALAIIDAKGEPARVDLRLGESNVSSRTSLASLTAPTGTDIYGIDSKGTIVRLTRAGDWNFKPPFPAHAIFPQADGGLVIDARHGNNVVLWLMRPPDTKLRDTVTLSIATSTIHAQVGDRVYFATDTALVGVRGRDLSEVPPIRVTGHIVALAPTPSGDRIYVAMEGDSSLAVIDRYTDKIASTVQLPGNISGLRMDGLGRYVLVKPVQGDSAWVIAVATNRVVGSVRTEWTDDLPATAPDGAIALNSGRDVIFVDGETLQAVRTVAGGAADYWYFTFWNGFRPRAAGVDQPVSFPTAATMSDSEMLAADSLALAGVTPESAATSGYARGPVPATPAGPPRPPVGRPGGQPGVPASPGNPVASPASPATNPALPPAAAAAAGQFTVSFAALLNEARAHAMADSIQVAGVRARVVPSQRAGTTIYRVVLGPYANRAAAEQIGRDSRRSYWVFPGQP